MNFKCAFSGETIESDFLPVGWLYPPKSWDLIKPIDKTTIASEIPPHRTIIAFSSENAMADFRSARLGEWKRQVDNHLHR